MNVFGIHGGPRPFVEALTARIEAEGGKIVELDEPAEDSDVVIVHCATEADWDFAAHQAHLTVVVIVLSTLDIDLYARALSLGAGVVHVDTSTEIIHAVAGAALSGESLVPVVVTQRLAGHWCTSRSAHTKLTLLEEQIADALIEGLTMQQIAADHGYSDRTIRRRLQGIYLKIGATNRADALPTLRAKRSGPTQAP